MLSKPGLLLRIEACGVLLVSLLLYREAHASWLLFAVLLLSLSWAVAQSYPSQSSSGSQESVKGCLSSVGGTYTLTAKDGKTYQLTGDTAR